MREQAIARQDAPAAGSLHLARNRVDRPMLRRDPLRVYANRAIVLDVIAITVAGITGFVLRWAIPFNVDFGDLTYVSLVVIVVTAWILVLILRGAYDTRILGVGYEEFERVVTATATVFGTVAVVAFALKIDLSRGFVLIAFIVGLVLLLAVRWSLRAWLRHERRLRQLPAPHHRHRLRADDVGGRRPPRPRPGRRLHRGRHRRGPGGRGRWPPEALGNWLDEVMTRIDLLDADTVAIAGSPSMGQEMVQRLAWRLEGPRVDLLVAPSVGDVAGPR
jgi:hypothetical protein